MMADSVKRHLRRALWRETRLQKSPQVLKKTLRWTLTECVAARSIVACTDRS